MEMSLKLLVFGLLHVVFIQAETDFYKHSVIDKDGQVVSLEKYRGKVTLVVNVASECGFTDGHYKGLVRAKNLLGRPGNFEILAFPCNQFGAQEPKGITEIIKFADSKYSANFPIFSKINVIEKDVPEAWQYLRAQSGVDPNWNFFKYLIDGDGKVLGGWGPWSDIEEIFPRIKDAVTANTAKQSTQGKPPAPGKPPGASTGAPQPPGSPGAPTGSGRVEPKPPSLSPGQPPQARSPSRPAHDDL